MAALVYIVGVLLFKKQKIFLFTIISMVVFVSSFRNEEFNQDTYSYSNYIGNALDSRMEFAFKYLLDYSSGLFEFNLSVSIIKIILIFLILYIDRSFKTKYFWIYFILCYQLLLDYTLARYGVAVLIIIFSMLLLERKKMLMGVSVMAVAPLFHYSTTPFIFYSLISLRHFQRIILLVFLAIMLLTIKYKYDGELMNIANYLSSKYDSYEANNMKIYKSLFDASFMLIFVLHTGFRKNLYYFLLYAIFSLIDLIYPSVGFNRVRIIFEMLIILKLSEKFFDSGTKIFEISTFSAFVLIRTFVAVNDFGNSSF